MSIQKLNPDNTEYFSIETNPSKSFSSRLARDASGALIYFTGANGNMEERLDNTGSVHVFAIRSPYEKETLPLGPTSRISYEDQGFEQYRRSLLDLTASNIENAISGYMSAVNETSQSIRKQAKVEILRFVPSFKLSSNSLRKSVTVNQLSSFYRTVYPSAHFGFSNYHSLNFFSSGSNPTQFVHPSSSVLLYPNLSSSLVVSGVYSSQYGINPGKPFTIDFWVNPRYTTDVEGEPYHAGTVLHLTSAYAVSVHSGSSVDINGKPNKFKLCLQIGATGSGLSPDSLDGTNTSWVFFSNENVLERNKWSHVTIRCGGDNYNNSTGSFFVNGANQGNFAFTNPGLGMYESAAGLEPSVLCVGNFYQGTNYLAQFFNATHSQRDGVVQLVGGTTDPPETEFAFSNPLNAEIHDLKLYNKYLTTTDIELLSQGAPDNLNNLLLYIPPFFTVESPYRAFVGTHGGELITPFFERDGTTETPYAADLAFGAGGHYPNLENYVRDFVTGQYPRLYHLTGSSIVPGNNVIQTANDFLYSSGSYAGYVKKRLYTVLPCDHGNWQPNFGLLSGMSGTLNGRYSNDLGNTCLGMVSLKDIVDDYTSLDSRTIFASGSILDEVLGTQPEPDKLNAATKTSHGGNSGFGLTMLHRLRDNTSNQVVFFDVSNLFYGNKIKPKSLVITDPVLSGSEGKFGMVLKDDGLGGLYRADCNSPHATWSSVGTVFYDEGIIMLKHPHLFFFGKEGFDISFRGVQNIHVMTINAYARSSQLISSSNPGFQKLVASPELFNEADIDYVYITGVNLHDENLNVISKTTLAQPIQKKTGDKMLFRIRFDF
jgi:hypothetical protein